MQAEPNINNIKHDSLHLVEYIDEIIKVSNNLNEEAILEKAEEMYLQDKRDFKKMVIQDGINKATAEQLKAFIERVEKLEEEKRQLAEDIKDVYLEAKANGFDVKVLREIVSLRRQDVEERRGHEEVLETYLRALGMV